MCTVTIVPDGPAGFNLASNRDELRRRAIALPPQIFQQAAVRYAMPVDPLGCGSWIAANEYGLVATLLNVNLVPSPGAFSGRASRGQIIPPIMGCESLAQAVAKFTPDPLAYPPFRLVLADATGVCEYRSDGRDLTHRHLGPINAGPYFFTSSGLGDHRVEAPRRALFDDMLSDPTKHAIDQRAFHQHVWPMQPELSVCMNRTDACTVSFTCVSVRRGAVLMEYLPGLACGDGSLSVLELSRESRGLP